MIFALCLTCCVFPKTFSPVFLNTVHETTLLGDDILAIQNIEYAHNRKMKNNNLDYEYLDLCEITADYQKQWRLVNQLNLAICEIQNDSGFAACANFAQSLYVFVGSDLSGKWHFKLDKAGKTIKDPFKLEHIKRISNSIIKFDDLLLKLSNSLYQMSNNPIK